MKIGLMQYNGDIAYFSLEKSAEKIVIIPT